MQFLHIANSHGPGTPFILLHPGNFLLTPVIPKLQGEGFLLETEHFAESFDISPVMDLAAAVCICHDKNNFNSENRAIALMK